MKKIKLYLLMLSSAFILSGCVVTPVPAIVSDASFSMDEQIKNEYLPKKVGYASCKQYVMIVGLGDCTVTKAMKNGNITKVHSVEHSAVQYLLFYGEYTTIVRGE